MPGSHPWVKPPILTPTPIAAAAHMGILIKKKLTGILGVTHVNAITSPAIAPEAPVAPL
jgi:hypothetical protein